MRPRSVNFTALSTRFSSAARSRTRSPVTNCGRSFAKRNLRHKPLGLGAHLQCRGDRVHDRAQPKGFRLQHQSARLGAHAVDDERRQIGEMLGRILDQRRPLAFTLGQIGGRDQLAQR